MKKSLDEKVSSFLKKHVPESSTIMLAFSGGVDSTALLHATHAFCKKMKKSLYLVHVDHGWREESKQEACSLHKMADGLNLPFLSYKLDSSKQRGNLEDWSRIERHRCFQQAMQEMKCSILLLAHQKDDQNELLVKRFFEGASLVKLRGMKEKDEKKEYIVLRPLLFTDRKEIEEYLLEKGIQPILDPTNKDTKFLRARMREELFPFLRKSLNKSFHNCLQRIREEAFLLEHFVEEELEERTAIDVHEAVVVGTVKKKLSSFLALRFVDALLQRANLPSSSRDQAMQAALALIHGNKRKFFIGRGALFSEKNYLIAFPEALHPWITETCDALKGTLQQGNWHLSWSKAHYQGEVMPTWPSLFSGKKVTVFIPYGPFSLSSANDRSMRKVHVHKSLYPVILRPYIPAIVQDGKIIYDFLSGYHTLLERGAACFCIHLEIKNNC